MVDIRIKLLKGDITKLKIDAIVNSANASLLAGSGMCGAIHRVAGIELEKLCKTLGGCKEGKAVITSGFNLPCKYVIHAVAPKWYLNIPNKEELLKGCYTESLKLAAENGIKTIAFPSIGTGIYKTPIEVGSRIAFEAVNEFLSENNSIEEVVFVCYSDSDLSVYEGLLT